MNALQKTTTSDPKGRRTTTREQRRRGTAPRRWALVSGLVLTLAPLATQAAGPSPAPAVSGERASPPTSEPMSLDNLEAPVDPAATRTPAAADPPAATSDPPAPSSGPTPSAPPSAATAPPIALQVQWRGQPRQRRLTLTPNVEFNLRGQGRYNASFDPENGDRTHDIFQRARLGLDANYGPIGVFIQAQDVRNWGFEDSTIANMANTDLHQGYLYIDGAKGRSSGRITLGRQEINVGSGRLIANRNWVPVAQSFDALRLRGSYGRLSGDAGVMLLARPGQFTTADPNDPTLTQTIRSPGTVSGFLKLAVDLGPAAHVEALGIALAQRPSAQVPTEHRNIINGGLRVYGKPIRGLSYDVEGYAQGGTSLGLRHRAFAAFTTLKYESSYRLRPALLLRYNYASGQSCEGAPEVGCGNQRSGEFYRFYGARHPFYGILDRVAHSNVRNLEAATSIKVGQVQIDEDTSLTRFEALLSYNFIQLDKPTGAWVNAPDQLVGAGWDPTNTSRNLGHELDLVLTYRPLEKLSLHPGYGVFIPMAGGQRIAGPAPQHFAYLMVVAKF